jgi:hypothetical protein
VADQLGAIVAGEPACDLFGREAVSEAGEHAPAQGGLAFELGPGPSPGAGPFLGIGTSVRR